MKLLCELCTKEIRAINLSGRSSNKIYPIEKRVDLYKQHGELGTVYVNSQCLLDRYPNLFPNTKNGWCFTK